VNRVKIYQVDAFSSHLFSGNPAAVCPLKNWLSDELMQSIAMENNLSETAFFVSKDDKYDLRWFTPKTEIELCGHATLATAHVLWSEMNCQDRTIAFNTLHAGILEVSREKDILRMNFPSLEPKEVDHDFAEEAAGLGARPSSFLVCNYGMAIFDNEQDIVNIVPDLNLLKRSKYDGIIVTAPGNSVDFVSRFFGPKLGINEDPVTGGAHCELIPYWSKRLNKRNMIAKQLSDRGGELYCAYQGDRVLMGGRAVTYLRGELLV